MHTIIQRITFKIFCSIHLTQTSNVDRLKVDKDEVDTTRYQTTKHGELDVLEGSTSSQKEKGNKRPQASLLL
jgi:hypothetical protein